MSSGFGRKGDGAAAFAQTALDNGGEDALEAATFVGRGEPETLNRGPETVAEAARNPRISEARRVDVRELAFEDETQARPVDDRLLDKLRREGAANAANAANANGGNANGGKRELVDYESLPSLEVRRPFDTYEAAFSERDPATQLHAARESARVRRAEAAAYHEPPVAFDDSAYNDEPATPPYENESESSYRDEPSYEDGAYRREESGPRERPLPPPARSYAAPVPSYDDASDSAQWGRDRAQPASEHIPPAPRVPEEMHPAFAVGVQRIRTATPDAWGTPHVAPPAAGQYLPSPMAPMQAMPAMPAMQSSLPPQYAPNQYPAYAYQHAYAQQQQQERYYPPAQPTSYAASPQQYLQPGQRQPTPMPMQGSAASPMFASGGLRAPVGGQLATQPPADAPNSKIGRFAWFVAGAAFGITFAFFATGFFNAGKMQNDAATAPVATVVAPPVAVTAPPIAPAPPVAIAAPQAAATAVTPASLPAVAPVAAVPPVAPVAAAAPGVAPAAPQAAAPVVRPAPPPRAPRFQAPPPRRPAPPVSQAPKNLGGGGPGADDERSAPPSPPPGADLGDLLGAGLKP